MNPLTLIVVYSTLVVIVTLIAGVIPSRLKLGHTGIQLVMSLVSGLMLGVAIFHLMPHGVQELGGAHAIDTAMLGLMAGLLTMFFMLRWFHFHQHDVTALDHDHHHPQDNCAHAGEAAGAEGSKRWAWLGVFGGLAIHTLFDGVALGAAIQADSEAGHAGLFAGVGVFLAIVLHKPLDAITIVSLMRRGQWPERSQLGIVLLFAMMLPLGALVFQGLTLWLHDHHEWVGLVLMFSAGVFLCISLSDLLPELHFHSHDRIKLTVLLCIGILIAYSITGLEPAYHNHSH